MLDTSPTGSAILYRARGRLPGKPVAIVDIGSNSVRLVSYEFAVTLADADLQ